MSQRHAIPGLLSITVGLLGGVLSVASAPGQGQTQGGNQPESQPPSLTLPAYTGYASPNPDAMRRNGKTGSIRRCDGTLEFYVYFASTGALTVTPAFTANDKLTLLRHLRIAIAQQPDGTPLAMAATTSGPYTGTIESAGYHRISLTTVDDTPIENLANITLSGPATIDAHASTVERRNSASVHLGYPVPAEHRDDIEWFYCEVTPRTDPLYTYYMATGWSRGYFGMQVNHPNERRLIFSVWDSGNEAIDRNKVKADDRVQLIAKGERVHASGFGNEGTGGHSHLVHQWKTGDTFRFLVHAATDPARPTHTTYTGWFWFADRNDGRGAWGLIASFRAPKDGKHLRGLYSFNENFGGSTGHQLRDCEFGNVWARTTAGEWLPLLRARFTHDGHGKSQRLDRYGGVRTDRFYLQNGGFVAPAPASSNLATTGGEHLQLPRAAGRPPASLPHR